MKKVKLKLSMETDRELYDALRKEFDGVLDDRCDYDKMTPKQKLLYNDWLGYDIHNK